MSTNKYFEIESQLYGAIGGSRTSRVFCKTEALRLAKALISLNSVFVVDYTDGNTSFGELVVEVDQQDLCAVTANEHRGFFVRGLPIKLALEIVGFWLPSQQRLPTVNWLDAPVRE